MISQGWALHREKLLIKSFYSYFLGPLEKQSYLAGSIKSPQNVSNLWPSNFTLKIFPKEKVLNIQELKKRLMQIYMLLKWSKPINDPHHILRDASYLVCSTSFSLHYAFCLEGPDYLDPGYSGTTLLLRDGLCLWYVLTGHQRRRKEWSRASYASCPFCTDDLRLEVTLKQRGQSLPGDIHILNTSGV